MPTLLALDDAWDEAVSSCHGVGRIGVDPQLDSLTQQARRVAELDRDLGRDGVAEDACGNIVKSSIAEGGCTPGPM